MTAGPDAASQPDRGPATDHETAAAGHGSPQAGSDAPRAKRPPAAAEPPTSAAARGSAAGRSIARADFEQVIRRAAELSLVDADPDEQLSEQEVLRIAAELGLPLQHVRQALFELPDLRVRPRWYDRFFGPAVFSVSRAIPTRKDPALRRVEDYLVTREYLQIVRRRGDTIAFIPADDTISSLARALARPNSRHTISRASRVMVGSHALPDDNAHVRFDVDLDDARREALRGGTVFGSFLGLGIGVVGALLTDGIPGSIGDVSQIIAFGSGMAAGVAGGISTAASRFRNRVFAAKMELTGLLDRLERGDRLDPPPAPWRRKLQLRLFGDRS